MEENIASNLCAVQPVQFDLFGPSRWPKKPYCSANKTASQIRSFDTAKNYPYIQPNPPAFYFRIVFDIDRETGAIDWQDREVATPNWSAQNRKNGHAHLGYEIGVPVVMTENAKMGPIRFAAAVEAAYLHRLDADIGYSGIVCKNPLHNLWNVNYWRDHPYDLEEMSEWVPLDKIDRRKKVLDYGMGRAVNLFETLRRWAYKHVDEYRQHGARAYPAWHKAVLERSFQISSLFPQGEHPFLDSEKRATARSVAKWTWRNFFKEESDKRFSALQAHRGRQKGKVKREEGINIIKQNPLLSDADIGSILGVDRTTVYRWRQSMSDLFVPA